MSDDQKPQPASVALRQLRERAGLSQRALAAATGMPLTTYNSYETRYSKPFLNFEFAKLLQPALVGRGNPPITVQDVHALVGLMGMAEPPASPFPTPSDTVTGVFHPSVETMLRREDMPRDVPVFGTVAGGNGKKGAFIMNSGGPVDYVRRPPGLLNNMSAFAMYVENDSMSPRFEPGELVYLDPNRPPMIGSDVCYEAIFGEGEETRTYIKRLSRRGPEAIRFEQFNPPETFEVPVAHIVRMFRVLTITELLGM